MKLLPFRECFRALCLAVVCWPFALGAAEAPAADTMAERTKACTACHGEQGKAGPDGFYPRLAGKPADYLFRQLTNFAEGRRHYTLMEGLLRTLDASYLREIAQHFASLSVPYPPAVPSRARADVLARGKALATQGDTALGLPSCARCHGKALTGVLPQTPGLLGLPADYINAQLGGWQTGQRRAHAPDCMAQVAKKLTAADVNAVSQWLSSQNPPTPYKPALEGADGPALAAQWNCKADLPTVVEAERRSQADTAQVTQGAYLARIGNCALCHTTQGGEPYAGGKAVHTPFGDVFSSNLTPDPLAGIGQWSADDFWQALHHGRSRNGRLLYPAFPYPNFTRVTRADSDALFAYLRTLKPSHRTNLAPTLEWPYNTQWALGLWRTLFFSPADAPPLNATAMERGAYLVRGLAHCGACHTPRNRLGAETTPEFGGATIPSAQAYAPSLLDPRQAGLGEWSPSDIATLLRSGTTEPGHTSRIMSEVVFHSTQHLSQADALAMATYLRTLSSTPAVNPPVTSPAAVAADVMQAGARIYEKQCKACHGAQGEGRTGIYPALAGNRFVTSANTVNLVQTLREGGFAPATHLQPRPFGMPPFQLTLNDREMGAVLTYIRNAWGNHAPAVP